MSVFILDKRHQPLMPCSEKRARLLLKRGRAVVHRRVPFTIRLKDRYLEDSAIQPITLKLDPGSKVTGIALARIESLEKTPDDDPENTVSEIHHALHLAELEHRGQRVHDKMVARSAARCNRRARHTRYRPVRFLNRSRHPGWLPPSLRSRLDETEGIVGRYLRWCPVSRIDFESVRFDTQALVNPEITGVEYQRGTLFGYEIQEYLLEKWQRRCAYCGATGIPLEKDHIIPRSRSGSNRVSNLTLACHDCNQAKGNLTAEEFGHPEVQRDALRPLRDAAAVNATRHALHRRLLTFTLPVHGWTGGRTKFNRTRLSIPKTHAADALCVGNMRSVTGYDLPVLHIKATGHGKRCRTLYNQHGFPRAYLPRTKRIKGFSTGDLVLAIVPTGKHVGTHLGRVAVRTTGRFRIGQADPISYRYCRLLQRADGYEYMKGARAVPPQA